MLNFEEKKQTEEEFDDVQKAIENTRYTPMGADKIDYAVMFIHLGLFTILLVVTLVLPMVLPEEIFYIMPRYTHGEWSAIFPILIV